MVVKLAKAGHITTILKIFEQTAIYFQLEKFVQNIGTETPS